MLDTGNVSSKHLLEGVLNTQMCQSMPFGGIIAYIMIHIYIFKRYCSNHKVNGIINVHRDLNMDASNLEMMQVDEKKAQLLVNI